MSKRKGEEEVDPLEFFSGLHAGIRVQIYRYAVRVLDTREQLIVAVNEYFKATALSQPIVLSK
jgi:hypothetical protein